MNLGTRLIISAVLLGSLVWLFRLVRQRRLRGKYVLPWLFAVPLLTLLVLFPAVLDWAADVFGVLDPVTAFLIPALAFALLLLVHSSWELSRLEERTRVLAEEVAILRSQVLQPDPPPADDPAADHFPSAPDGSEVPGSRGVGR